MNLRNECIRLSKARGRECILFTFAPCGSISGQSTEGTFSIHNNKVLSLQSTLKSTNLIHIYFFNLIQMPVVQSWVCYAYFIDQETDSEKLKYCPSHSGGSNQWL